MTERSAQVPKEKYSESEFGHISPEPQQDQVDAAAPEVRFVTRASDACIRESVFIETLIQLDFGFKVPEVILESRADPEVAVKYNPKRSMDHKRFSQRQTMRRLTRNKIV